MDQRVAGKRQIARFHDRRARERGRQLSQAVVVETQRLGVSICTVVPVKQVN
jgi:hypothetical protein